MLWFYRCEDSRLVEAAGIEECQIVRALRPDDGEVELLRKATGAPRELLLAAVDRDERPRIEIDEGFKLLVIRVPHLDRQVEDVQYITISFGIILTPAVIITVCSEESGIWEDILGRRLRFPDPRNQVHFLCGLFMHVAKQFLTNLNSIRREANEVESAIRFSMKNEMLIRMMNLEKCLVYYTTSLRANEPIWDRLPRIHERKLTEFEEDLLDDVRIEFRQAKELADIHSNILSGMMDAFASIISNNLNVVMKFLTSITIILMLPTLVASIYGMNVELPFQHSPHAFASTMLLSTSLSVLVVLVFLKKKLF